MSKVQAGKTKISLAQPVLDEEMQAAALDAMRNERWLLGESVYKFEEEFAKYCGTDYAISTSSGTAAISLSLIALGVRSSDVVTTPMSFVATANAIIHAGATPRFADANDQTYCIDPTKMKEAVNEKTRAVIPVHLYGYPSGMNEICEIANKRDIPIVEDACQAHGAIYDGKRIGSMGIASCFSFYPSKNMTVAGDGGMVTTNDDSLREGVRSLSDCGRIKGKRYFHSVIGFSQRLNTIQAAIGRVQLRRLDIYNERRRQVAQMYNKLLNGVGDLILPPAGSPEKIPVHHMYVIRTKLRDSLRDWLASRSIECGIHYPLPIHLQPVYQQIYGYQKGDYPSSEKMCEQVLSIPMHPNLTSTEVEFVSQSISEFYEKTRPTMK